MTQLVLADGVQAGWLTNVLLNFARGGAEWVLWILVVLFVGSLVIFFERLLFLRAAHADAATIRELLIRHIPTREVSEAQSALAENTSMEARVLLAGLVEVRRGPDAVAELCRGAIGVERIRYERFISFLATVGSNAPFIGLFGTVIGVIMAFDQLRDLDGGGAAQSEGVMGAIAEALIATGVGLLVAIPAIIFFNILKSRVNRIAARSDLLVRTLVALLREESVEEDSFGDDAMGERHGG